MNEPTTDITTIATQTQADQNPARVYLAGLSHGSRATMFSALATIAAYLRGSDPEVEWGELPRTQRHAEQVHLIDTTPWHAIRHEHTQALRSVLSARYSPATANRMLTALRQVMTAAWHLGQMSTDELGHAKAVKGVSGSNDQAAGRRLEMGEEMALLSSCYNGKPSGTRDAAIFAIGLGAGLRRQEIANLTLDSYRAGKLTVIGKGNKTRTVPLPKGAIKAIDAWLALRGTEPGPLFHAINRWEQINNNGLTPEAIRKILIRRALAAEIDPVTPHDLRRTYATNLIAASVPLPTVQKLMGHASVTTTANYDRAGEDAKIAAANTIFIPYQETK